MKKLELFLWVLLASVIVSSVIYTGATFMGVKPSIDYNTNKPAVSPEGQTTPSSNINIPSNEPPAVATNEPNKPGTTETRTTEGGSSSGGGSGGSSPTGGGSPTGEKGKGTVWTTNSSCGPQQENEYQCGDEVYLRGYDLKANGVYNYTIENSTSAHGSVIVSGTVTANSSGEFNCLLVWDIPSNYSTKGQHKITVFDDKTSKTKTFDIECECSIICSSNEDCGPSACEQNNQYWGFECVNPGTCNSFCNSSHIGTNNDNDGYDSECSDCDDNNANIYPGATEVCNNLDDDCDQAVDEDLIEACGSDQCTGTKTCTAGTWSDCSTYGNDIGICAICDATGTPIYDETQDDDCEPTTCPQDGCGQGCNENIFGDYPESVNNECAGTYTCTNNQCTATCEEDVDQDGYSSRCGDCNVTNANVNPGATELCNNLDDDCDQLIDEDYPLKGTSCTVGVGACMNEGVYVCSATHDGVECSAIEGTPSEETCNNIDDDCDGEIDEGINPIPTECGVGACHSTGYETCTGGQWIDDCTPGQGSAETCNNIDDDCDGVVDENMLPMPTTCGVGACYATGNETCTGGQWIDDCTPGTPGTEICDNGEDDDCDESTDCDDTDCEDSSDCAVCGNNITESGEECDGTDNSACNSGRCLDNCTCFVPPPTSPCGNGILEPEYQEECDPPYIEQCDNGCNTTTCQCLPPPPVTTCGDGVMEGGEECDDGNLNNGDGCSDMCIIEYCGDTVVNNNNEQCDPPESRCENGAICNNDCQCPIVEEEMDFGDAPNSYSTLLASNGARHVAVGPMIGVLRDVEPDGQPVDQDDVNGIDDEEMMSYNSKQGTLDVTFSNIGPNGAYFNLWVDFNQDGDFADVGEHVYTNVLVQSAQNNIMQSYPLAIPPNMLIWLRARFSSNPGDDYDDLSLDGEVNDMSVYTEEGGPQPVPEFSTLGVIFGIVVIALATLFFTRRKKK